MADAVLSFALETVRDLLLEEGRFLFNVKGEVEEIGAELERMRDFLKRADAKKDEDEALNIRVTQIRSLATEVEDVLETFAIEVASHRSKGGVKNTLKRSACIINECIALHKVGSEIVSIKTKLTNFTNGLPRYEIPRGGERQQRLQTYPHFEDDFVGMEDDIKQLVSHLVNEENTYQVVSICGMGGVGKTSLAKKVYNHVMVKSHFHCSAWACISQQWNTVNVLQEILRGLVPHNKESIMNMTLAELYKELYEVQEKKKCLVVIDDIWSTEAWDCLKEAFPIGKTHSGSKLLLTTRYSRVALYADPNGFSHDPQCLSEEESWELLQKKAFQKRDMGTGHTIDSRMEELAKEMMKHCRGLPLAVVVLGGILVMRNTVEEWEMVLQDINKYLARGEGRGKENGSGRGVSSVLDLSYKDLPYHLKPCFLYLANFPEDSEIKAKKLYRLWIAERIVSSDCQRNGQTMMDVAQEYLVELAQRCLVQVREKKKNTARRRFKSCSLHDLMREVCLEKVKEENFLKVIGSGVGHESSSKTRRLAFHSSDKEVGGCEMSLEKQRARHVRSLLIFGGGEISWFKMKDGLSRFKLLCVLHLEGSYELDQKFIKSIGKITQLRYLRIKDSKIDKLPSSVGKLGYLETLDLRTDEKLFIPNVLWKLKRLRHLYLPEKIKLLEFRLYRKWGKKLRLDGLNNLETLVNFHSDTCDAKDLLKLNNLRKLNATVRRNREHLAHLVTATNSVLLRQSTLGIEDYSFRSEAELNVLRKLLGCHHLNKLWLNGPISKLPEHWNFSPNLTELTLEGTKLEDDPMPTLGKLPSLVHLYIHIYVFMGKEVVCSSTDFPQLTSLRNWWGLPNLENWTVDQGAFPKLSYCEISDCPKLKMIPDGFAFLTALKTLKIREMSEEFIDRVVKGVDGKEGEDYHKLQHIPSITINYEPLI